MYVSIKVWSENYERLCVGLGLSIFILIIIVISGHITDDMYKNFESLWYSSKTECIY